MRRILYFAILTLLASVSLSGAVESAISLEQLLTGTVEVDATASPEVLGWQAILAGDDEAAQQQFIAAIEADPDGLMAEALLRDQLRFVENVVRFSEFRGVCERILQRENVAPATRRAARRWLYYFASQQMDETALARLSVELGYLEQWQVIAPFIEVGYLDFNRPFEPEERIRESYELPSLGEYTWQTPSEGLYQGFVAFEDYSPIARGVGYALDYIYLPEAGDYQLHLESDDSIRIFLDDVEVGLRDSHFSYPAVESSFGFRAEAGWHRLLIKSLRQTTSSSAQIPISWGFRLALTDSAGEAVLGSICKVDLELERELSRGEVLPLPQSEPIIDGASERFYRAMIAAHQEDYDGAIELLNGLVEEYPESVLGRLALAWVLDSDGSPERAARARTNYSRVVAAAPETVPAQLALAEIEAEEGKFWSSLERLKSLTELAPESERVLLTLAERYRDRGFTSLEREALQNAEELAPDNLSVLHRLALFHRRQRDFNQAEEYLLRTVRLAPDNLILWRDLADLL
ncbi:tetratricopeptide repeat protein, partial [bacterium]|nr:tetratricopeptide repeat protein [bacterium]